MKTIQLILGFRFTHAPGETDAALARAWERVHAPIIGLLEDLPGIPAALHLSGVLLDFLEQRYEKDLARIKALVARGQVDVLGGGYYDPVLSLISERDGIGQIRLMTRRVEAFFGIRPAGAWLVQGAWDPSLPRVLGRQNLDFALLDGSAFRAIGISASQVRGYFSTEREGVPLAVFPVDTDLDGLDPMMDTSQVMTLFRRKAAAGQQCVTWMVDARNFGLRPGTWECAWGREGGWMPRLLRQIAGQDHWLKTTSFRAYMGRSAPERRVYLPSTMVPTLQALSSGLDLPKPGSPPPPPALFEAFLARYDEVNRLHKRLLHASRALEQLDRALRAGQADPKRLEAMKDAQERGLLSLYKGQTAAAICTDPWGGAYDGRVRHEAYASAIRAEWLVSRALSTRDRIRFDKVDLDCDQHEEVLVQTPSFSAVVDPNAGGALTELDAWALPGNLLNTFARREEPWHNDALDDRDLPMLVADDTHVEIDDEDNPPPPVTRPPPRPFTVHHVAVDTSPRDAFIDRFLGPEATLENLRRGQFPERGDFVGATYEMLRTEPQDDVVEVLLARDGMVETPLRPHSLRIVKRYRFRRDRATFDVGYKIQNRYFEPVNTTFAVELNLNLDSERTGRQYLWLDRDEIRDLVKPGERKRVLEIVWGDEDRGFQTVLTVSQACGLWHYPVETLRRTPDGAEVAWQGTCLVLRWDMPLWGNEQWMVDLGVTLRVARPGVPQATVRAAR